MNAIVTTLLLVSLSTAFAQPRTKDLNTLRSFPPIDSKAEWKERAESIREHVLVSCGLWPLPPKTPLNQKVFGRIDRDGYSIEKVYFETYPGFYLAGNLYRPLGRGDGPFPAILNPHGHWSNGRMADEQNGSLAARCISFARQGAIAFSYDMVGYNDTRQVDHKFGASPTNLLWNISLMGLQTWNSIRALDFLESLPDTDAKRLACTGESGGGTQTFILGAIDDRLAAQAPVVMVSHSMQGGCLCENAPGLRVDYSNMEIAAAPAPRPQIIVAATGDWTKKTMEVEGPSIQRIYDLLGAPERFRHAIFDYPHNYNRTTREAVYAAFTPWLLRGPDGPVSELPYKKEPDADLRVFPDQLPSGALDEAQLGAQLVALFARQARDLSPAARATAWEHALQLQHVRFAAEDSREGERVIITREPESVRITLNIRPGKGPIALLLGEQPDLREKLEAAGLTVVTTDACSGEPAADQLKNFYCTYNRTWVQSGAANIKAASEYLRRRFPRSKLALVANREAAGPALASAPLVDAVVADCAGLDDSNDQSLLGPNSFFPGIRRVGSFQGILALAAAKPALLHGAGDKLQLDDLKSKKLDRRAHAANAGEIAEFIAMSMR
jgi:dienelactone hydrolase